MAPDFSKVSSPTGAVDGKPNWLPGVTEWVAVLGVLLGFLILNVVTYRLYPAVWADEVSFSEPAINYAQSGHFVTRVWPYQPNNTFPSVNCPLYGMSLAAWLSVAGTSLLATRMLNYLLVGLAALFAWMISWRCKLVAGARSRIALVLLVESGYGMSAAFRSSRPDMLGAVLILLLVLAVGCKNRPLRTVSLLLLPVAIVWTGLHLALAVSFACFVGWIVLREFPLKNLVTAAAGMVLGALSLAWFMNLHHALSNLMVTISSVTDHRAGSNLAASIFSAVRELLQKIAHNYLDDYSCLPILAGIILSALLLRTRAGQFLTRPLCYLASLVLLIPILLNVAGHFVIFYSFLLFIPTCLLFLTLMSSCSSASVTQSSLVKIIFAALIALAVGVGLPLRLVLAKSFCVMADPVGTADFFRKNLRHDDVVFTDYLAFYDVKKFTEVVYVPDHTAARDSKKSAKRELTAGERAAISVLIASPEESQQYIDWLGGTWEVVGTPPADSLQVGAAANWPVIGRKLVSYFSQSPCARHTLQFYRRKTETTVSPP